MEMIVEDKLQTRLQDSRKILSVYFTAGFPKIKDTAEILIALQKHGCDLVEIGFPFSDPLADGPVIQHSSHVAIENGMNLEILFQQLRDLKSKLQIPCLLMGYANPMLQYGVEEFCREAAACGVSGVIIPDISPESYAAGFRPVFEKHKLHFIHLITPETTENRIRFIDSVSTAFIYAVSSSATTGSTAAGQSTLGYLQRIQQMQLKHPVLTGFGISNARQFRKITAYCRGAIIGSAFIKNLVAGPDIENNIELFIKSISL